VFGGNGEDGTSTAAAGLHVLGMLTVFSLAEQAMAKPRFGHGHHTPAFATMDTPRRFPSVDSYIPSEKTSSRYFASSTASEGVTSWSASPPRDPTSEIADLLSLELRLNAFVMLCLSSWRRRRLRIVIFAPGSK